MTTVTFVPFFTRCRLDLEFAGLAVTLDNTVALYQIVRTEATAEEIVGAFFVITRDQEP